MTTRSAILQCRLTAQEKTDFQKAAATQKGSYGYGYRTKTPGEVLRELALEFTKNNFQKVKPLTPPPTTTK